MKDNSYEKNEKKIEVSILCLAYNHGKYIKKTLEGFVKQKTNFQFEVLIHDDASTDETVDIIKDYAEKFPDIIKPIYQCENQYSKGVKITYKYQFPRVKGKYVAYCEGDDYWCDEYKLQKQYDVMEHNPNCTICTCKVRCINEDGTLNDKTIPPNNYGIHGGLQNRKALGESIWHKGYPFHTSSYFIRFSCISKYYDYDFKDYFNGDEALLRTAINFGDLWYIDEEMSFRRLWSIGNWNNRFYSSPYETKRLHWTNQIKGNILYDKFSNGKFHSYINRYISKRILAIAGMDMSEYHVPFKKAYSDILNEFEISSSKAFLNFDLKSMIKYFLLRYAPNLYSGIKKLRNTV